MCGHPRVGFVSRGNTCLGGWGLDSLSWGGGEGNRGPRGDLIKKAFLSFESNNSHCWFLFVSRQTVQRASCGGLSRVGSVNAFCFKLYQPEMAAPNHSGFQVSRGNGINTKFVEAHDFWVSPTRWVVWKYSEDPLPAGSCQKCCSKGFEISNAPKHPELKIDMLWKVKWGYHC